MRCALIEAEKANYPIAWMCRQLAVPRSSFYAWRARSRHRDRHRRPPTGAGRAGPRRSSMTAAAPTAAAGSRPSSTGKGTRPASE